MFNLGFNSAGESSRGGAAAGGGGSGGGSNIHNHNNNDGETHDEDSITSSEPRTSQSETNGNERARRPTRRTRRRRHRSKKSQVEPEQNGSKGSGGGSGGRKSAGGGKKAHDNPMTRKNIYFSLETETVGIGPGGVDSAIARVTVVNWESEIVLDTFVKVPVPVTDYRTRVSGIRPEDLDMSESSAGKKIMTFEQARSAVEVIIRQRILIGHGLKNHLSALGLTHPFCDTRDTALYAPYMFSVVDPRTGKYAFRSRNLRDLAREKLERAIQEDGAPRSTLNDAMAALDLYKAARVDWEKALIDRQQQQQRTKSSWFSSGSTMPDAPLAYAAPNVVRGPGYDPSQYWASSETYGDGHPLLIRYPEEASTAFPECQVPIVNAGVSTPSPAAPTATSPTFSYSSWFSLRRPRSPLSTRSDEQDGSEKGSDSRDATNNEGPSIPRDASPSGRAGRRRSWLSRRSLRSPQRSLVSTAVSTDAALKLNATAPAWEHAGFGSNEAPEVLEVSDRPQTEEEAHVEAEVQKQIQELLRQEEELHNVLHVLPESTEVSDWPQTEEEALIEAEEQRLAKLIELQEETPTDVTPVGPESTEAADWPQTHEEHLVTAEEQRLMEEMIHLEEERCASLLVGHEETEIADWCQTGEEEAFVAEEKREIEELPKHEEAKEAQQKQEGALNTSGHSRSRRMQLFSRKSARSVASTQSTAANRASGTIPEGTCTEGNVKPPTTDLTTVTDWPQCLPRQENAATTFDTTPWMAQETAPSVFTPTIETKISNSVKPPLRPSRSYKSLFFPRRPRSPLWTSASGHQNAPLSPTTPYLEQSEGRSTFSVSTTSHNPWMTNHSHHAKGVQVTRLRDVQSRLRASTGGGTPEWFHSQSSSPLPSKSQDHASIWERHGQLPASNLLPSPRQRSDTIDSDELEWSTTRSSTAPTVCSGARVRSSTLGTVDDDTWAINRSASPVPPAIASEGIIATELTTSYEHAQR